MHTHRDKLVSVWWKGHTSISIIIGFGMKCQQNLIKTKIYYNALCPSFGMKEQKIL